MRREDLDKAALAAHKRLAGKITIENKDQLDSVSKLNLYYTPGVAAVSSYLYKHPAEKASYTGTNNSVAIVSDGSAVLGLGNIGAAGALPVMEGKAMLFRQFAKIDAFPIVLDTHDPAQIIAAVKAIAPSFGAINLEDIASPQCFEIEYILKRELAIPIMHDDQHGTAVVVLAGLINAFKVVGKNINQSKIVIIGAGAAGSAVARIIVKYAKTEVVVIDSQGAIHRGRAGLNIDKQYLAERTNPKQLRGELAKVVVGADAVIGVSKGGGLTQADIRQMAERPIVFALANPTPEIMPVYAKAAGAAVIATGRSDFPNQVNNALAFPGIFRGALDHKVKRISSQHKLAAAKALAGLVGKPTPSKIIPSIFDRRVCPTIARVIR